MIDDKFISLICHKECKDGNIENAGCNAFLLDGENGLAQHLKFNNNEIGIGDYFTHEENEFQLIELTDLEANILECKLDIQENIKAAEIRKGGSLSVKERKKIEKSAWFPLTYDFIKKMTGSKLVIERLYRKNSIIDSDPNFSLLIVCKDKTDARMLDAIKARLIGIIPRLTVCNTREVKSLIKNIK